MSSPAVFDSVAARYDEQWTRTPIGRAQRNLVWRNLEPLFRPGNRILDVGCGTGVDASHFAARGVAVHAIDPSPAMVQLAQERGGFTSEVIGAEDLTRIDGLFDGAISNFGALNCVSDLPAVARELARLMRPGSVVAICIIGRFCAWESLYYSLHFRFGKAFRRLRSRAQSSLGITVYYPSVTELARAFAPGFNLHRWMGIGLLVPPSYVPLPGPAVRILGAMDRALARLPLLRAAADHRLLLFVRK